MHVGKGGLPFFKEVYSRGWMERCLSVLQSVRVGCHKLCKDSKEDKKPYYGKREDKPSHLKNLEILSAENVADRRKTFGGTAKEDLLKRIEVAKREEGL